MPKRPADPSSLPPDPRAFLGASQYEMQQLLELQIEAKKRRIESLKLYEPLPFQDAYHACAAKECILRKANQAGGSVAGFVEVARAVTAQDPYGKYPKRDGVAVCLGYGERHIGNVIHRYLFRAGAFWIIRDEQTREWRVFRPWSPDVEFQGKRGDLHRESEKKLAPPLIPQRFIDGKISYVKRSEFIFSYVRFTTGWELYAFNSAGDPGQAQGFQCDLYHIDEDLATAGWLQEAIGRTSIRRGRIRWTAVPQEKTDDMMLMLGRAEEQENEPDPSTVLLRATMYDNPYFPAESKKQNERIWRSEGEDVYRKRALGELMQDNVRMYPTFSEDTHRATKQLSEQEKRQEAEGKALRTRIQKILTERGGQPPEDWTRYLFVDPGHTVCAATLFAVPPLALGEFKVQYDEIYLQSSNVSMFAKALKPKVQDYRFEDFIMDMHGGKLTSTAGGKLPYRQYEEALEEAGIECTKRGPRFGAACDQVEFRENALRSWLEIRPDGSPTYLIIVEKCPNTCREIRQFKKKKVKDRGKEFVINEGNRRVGTHAVECVEYAAAHGLPYVKPKARPAAESYAERIIREEKARARKMRTRMFGSRDSSIVLAPRGSE